MYDPQSPLPVRLLIDLCWPAQMITVHSGALRGFLTDVSFPGENIGLVTLTNSDSPDRADSLLRPACSRITSACRTARPRPGLFLQRKGRRTHEPFMLRLVSASRPLSCVVRSRSNGPQQNRSTSSCVNNYYTPFLCGVFCTVVSGAVHAYSRLPSRSYQLKHLTAHVDIECGRLGGRLRSRCRNTWSCAGPWSIRNARL